jgi:hypothetical protein
MSSHRSTSTSISSASRSRSASSSHHPSRPSPISRLHSSTTNLEFRVPTKEVPLPSLPTYDLNQSLATWEPDESVSNCHQCQRAFGIFLRKHHCRRCGLIHCAYCSPHLDKLERDDFVREKVSYGEGGGERWSSLGEYRTCDPCHEALARLKKASTLLSPDTLFAIPSSSSSSSSTTTVSTSAGMIVPPSPSISGRSDVSTLSDCPVCGMGLGALGEDQLDQERHVQDCLDNSSGVVKTNGKYLGK